MSTGILVAQATVGHQKYSYRQNARMHENSKNSVFTVGLRSCRVPAQRHSDREIGRLSIKDVYRVSTLHGKAQKTDLRAVQLYEKKEPKIPQDQTLKFSRKKSVKSSMK